MEGMTPTAPRPPAAQQRSIRVLVVDDNPIMLFLYRHFFEGLERDDLQLIEAHDGEQALQALEEGPIDLVLSDHRMGAVTGVDVLATCLQQQPDAVRILMTGYPDPALAKEAHARAEVDAFIEKPLDLPALEQVLQEVVGVRLPPPGERS